MSRIILILSLCCQWILATYVLQDDYNTDNFLDKFNFFNQPDPTQGYVNYVDGPTATKAGLAQQRNNTIYLGVDTQAINPQPGRMSVRLESKATYDQGLVILDLAHMPASTCGTWPAFWMVGPAWPSNGEIDIIEGVNSQQSNGMALHTGPGCSISNPGMQSPNGGGPPSAAGRMRFSGSIRTSNCDVNAPGQASNSGCSIASQDDSTYGDGFNAAGGGVYATEWTPSAISIYHFSRAQIPADIIAGQPNPASWGTPLAVFQGCNFKTAIAKQQIVFDNTFCGSWAGQVWSSDAVCSKKAATCQEYVANNPAAFVDSFWEINSLKVYQNNGAGYIGPLSSAPSTPPQASASGILRPRPSSQTSLAGPKQSTLRTRTRASLQGPTGVPNRTGAFLITQNPVKTTTALRGPATGAPALGVPGSENDCNNNATRGGCISRRPVRSSQGFIGRKGKSCRSRSSARPSALTSRRRVLALE